MGLLGDILFLKRKSSIFQLWSVSSTTRWTNCRDEIEKVGFAIDDHIPWTNSWNQCSYNSYFSSRRDLKSSTVNHSPPIYNMDHFSWHRDLTSSGRGGIKMRLWSLWQKFTGKFLAFKRGRQASQKLRFGQDEYIEIPSTAQNEPHPSQICDAGDSQYL